MGTDAHNGIFLIETCVNIPATQLRWVNGSSCVKAKPIWPKGYPLSAVTRYKAQWLDIEHVNESDVLCLLIRERLLDGKLRTSLSPAQPV